MNPEQRPAGPQRHVLPKVADEFEPPRPPQTEVGLPLLSRYLYARHRRNLGEAAVQSASILNAHNSNGHNNNNNAHNNDGNNAHNNNGNNNSGNNSNDDNADPSKNSYDIEEAPAPAIPSAFSAVPNAYAAGLLLGNPRPQDGPLDWTPHPPNTPRYLPPWQGIDPIHPRHPIPPSAGDYELVFSEYIKRFENRDGSLEPLPQTPRNIGKNFDNLLDRNGWEIHILTTAPEVTMAPRGFCQKALIVASKLPRWLRPSDKSFARNWSQSFRIQASTLEKLVDYMHSGVGWFIHPDAYTPPSFRDYSHNLRYRQKAPDGTDLWAAEVQSTGMTLFLAEEPVAINVRQRSAREHLRRAALYSDTGSLVMWVDYDREEYNVMDLSAVDPWGA